MGPIVNVDWLAARLGAPDLVVVDCRQSAHRKPPGRPTDGWPGTDARGPGFRLHSDDPVPGAVFLDLESGMCGPVREHGGRHPLPDLGTFSLLAGELGIGNDTDVVAYDDQGGAVAARLWWMLTFLGHRRVFVLDGGHAAWKNAGRPAGGHPPAAASRRFSPRVHTAMMIAADELRNKLGAPGVVLVDSREPARFRGEADPIDGVSGRIPGSINRYWKESLDDRGFFRSPEEQAARFAGIGRDDEVIVYSGSGVTACVNVLALRLAGFRNVRLYVGGWSDWISYGDHPIETGGE